MLPPERFQTVKQPEGSKICGACVAAMATGNTLEHTQLSMSPVRHKEGGYFYTSAEVFTFLARYGVCAGLHFSQPEGQNFVGISRDLDLLVRLSVKGHPALVGVPSETFPGSGHWVFWDGEVIRDPSPKMPETGLVEDYHIQSWIPLTYIDNTKELEEIAPFFGPIS